MAEAAPSKEASPAAPPSPWRRRLVAFGLGALGWLAFLVYFAAARPAEINAELNVQGLVRAFGPDQFEQRKKALDAEFVHFGKQVALSEFLLGAAFLLASAGAMTDGVWRLLARRGRKA